MLPVLSIDENRQFAGAICWQQLQGALTIHNDPEINAGGCDSWRCAKWGCHIVTLGVDKAWQCFVVEREHRLHRGTCIVAEHWAPQRCCHGDDGRQRKLCCHQMADT